MATIVDPNLEEDKNQQGGQGSSNVTQAGGLTGVSGTSGVQAQQGQQRQQQGSGRFTNLQKYLQANQGAGQQIAGEVGGKLQEDISQKKDQAQDYYGKLGQSVDKARTVATGGGDFLQQLKGIGANIDAARQAGYNNRGANHDLGIQKFTSNSDQFRNFQDIQAGRGIDERLLAAQQADAVRSTQDYQQAAQDALQGVSSEGGRFDLLRKTFGGNVNPQYSTGAQRLDQLFLARQGLGGLQEDLSQDVKDARDLSRQTTQTGADVSNISQQERQLISDINQQTSANEQAYIDMLGSFIPEIQQQRDAEWNALESALSSYRPPPPGQVGTMQIRPGLSGEQLRRLGVNRQYGAFDVLENLSGAGDVAVKGRAAQDYRDAATQGDVDRYAALARMAGISPDRLTQAANLGETYTARGGEANLANRLQQAQIAFDKKARETSFDHSHSGRRGKNFFSGRGAVYGGGARGTAANLLRDGQSAIDKYTFGDTSGGWGGHEANRGAEQVWDDFRRFLDENKYARTIGGGSSKNAQYGYGTRATPSGLGANNPLPYGTSIKLGAQMPEAGFRYK